MLQRKEKFDIAGFERDMANIVRTAQEVDKAIRADGCNVIVKKDVKSGARRLMECLALRNTDIHGKHIVHVYVTKLDRNDINEQLEEMADYGIVTNPGKIQRDRDITTLCDHVDRQIGLEVVVFIHIDESDFGTDDKQLLSQVFRRYIRPTHGQRQVYFITYSATNDEAMLSHFGSQHDTRVVYLEPGPWHRGAKWFYEEGLVENAVPFWDFHSGRITPQGEECVRLLLESDKIFGVLRLATDHNYGKALRTPGFRNYFDQHGIELRFVDKDRAFVWENAAKGNWCGYVYQNQKCILVINQTCTRSTEVGFHQHIAFWHDYRNGDGTPFNTRCQAYERCNHYDEVGHRIKIYAHVPTYQLSAKLITVADYIEQTGIDLSKRVKSKTQIQKYTPEFYVEGVVGFSYSMSNQGRPILEFDDERVVPADYKDAGSKEWHSTLVSKWRSAGKGQHRDPLYCIMRGSKRDAKEPVTCIDDVGSSPLGVEFMRWAVNESVVSIAGNSIHDAIKAGKLVFCLMRPLPESYRKILVAPKTERSMFNAAEIYVDSGALTTAPSGLESLNSKADDLTVMAQAITAHPDNVKLQEELWCQVTSKSRASFFRTKKQLETVTTKTEKADDLTVMAQAITAHPDNVKLQEELWCQVTSKSRASFFRTKKQLEAMQTLAG